MKLQFNQASYLSQVRRLRDLADHALARYALRVRSVRFIQHAENTTFRVECRNNQKYLLRIHRPDYHNKAAILEELNWIDRLSALGLEVPTPVKSKNGDLVETVECQAFPSPRNCCVFKWIEGRFLEKALSTKHMGMAGRLLAEMQSHTRATTRHRNYWTANGLVGATPKFGTIDHLAAATPDQQRVITKTRRMVLKKLKAFERQFPSRQGLIHADLHFGNCLLVKDHLGAIDFDDCGQGFFAYDVMISQWSAQAILGPKRRREWPEFRQALIEGYKTKMPWDAHDDEIFDYMIAARRLLMLGWLNSRSDNPSLKKHLASRLKMGVAYFRKEFGVT